MKTLLAILFVVLAALGPPIKLAAGVPTLRPELFVVGLAFVLGHFRLVFEDRISKLLFAFLGLAVVAITMSYTVFLVPFDGNDLSVLPMLVQYWLVYCYWKGIANAGISKPLIFSIPLVVAVAAVVGIAQKYNLAGVNEWLTERYMVAAIPEIREGYLRALRMELGYARTPGTVGDPRHFAYLLSVGVSAAIAWLMHRRVLGLGTILMLGAMILAGGASFLCQSRTGLAALGVQFGVAGLLYWRRTGNPMVPIAMAAVFAGVLAFGWQRFSDDSIEERLFMEGSELIESSGYARIRDFKEPFGKGMENPLILVTGMGPAKAVLPGSEHGEVGWVTLRFGLVGLWIYVSLMYWSFRRVIYIYRKARRRADATLVMFLLSGMSVWGLYWVAESIFKLGQLMSLNMMIVGLAFGLRPPIRRRRATRRHTRPGSRERVAEEKQAGPQPTAEPALVE